VAFDVPALLLGGSSSPALDADRISRQVPTITMISCLSGLTPYEQETRLISIRNIDWQMWGSAAREIDVQTSISLPTLTRPYHSY
jgi:hypothetical protein